MAKPPTPAPGEGAKEREDEVMTGVRAAQAAQQGGACWLAPEPLPSCEGRGPEAVRRGQSPSGVGHAPGSQLHSQKHTWPDTLQEEKGKEN